MTHLPLLRNREDYIHAFARYVSASPSSYHAAHRAAAILREAGFVQHHETAQWPGLTPGARGVLVRDGAVIAWKAGAEITARSPIRVLGAHTDSPGFVVKPHPEMQTAGWQQSGVEIYGGPLLNSWLDRDLGYAGRITTDTGCEYLVHTDAVARIPQLAIHLDRDANSGLTLDRQRHTQPVIGVASAGDSSLAQLWCDAVTLRNEPCVAHEPGSGCAQPHSSRVAGADMRLFDAQDPARLGMHRELFASPRLDNLTSTFAGIIALRDSDVAPDTIAVCVAFDHEELGSETRSGASGPLLEQVISRLRAGLGASTEDSARALANSWCISADTGHAVHPNYSEKHDPQHTPVAGGGPMLKVNANQRYASDAHGAALWQQCCDAAGVPQQTFVSNNAVPCGTTIGPLTATRIGIRTVDVGVPILSMHAARELAHVDDLFWLAQTIAAFYELEL